MIVFENPGPDGWDIPLYGLRLAPGERAEVLEANERIVVDATGQATIETVPAVTPEAEKS